MTARSLAFVACMILAWGPMPAAGDGIEPPYIVADVETGEVLAERDALRPWYPASLTKMMTTYVTLEAVEAGEVAFDSPVRITHKAASEPPSKMGFKAGTVITVETALKIIMVKSANDVTMALAEAVGGSEGGFIRKMNEAARKLGMSRSRFANPHGLPSDQQLTSARDMAILARALLTDFPQHRDYLDVPALRFGGRTFRNYNMLLERYPDATGMKTGFICDSGYNLAASASRDGREIVAIVFGANSALDRADRAAVLLDKGFATARTNPARPTLQTVRSGARFASATSLRSYICGSRQDQLHGGRFIEPRFRNLGNGRILVQRNGVIAPSPLTPRRSAGPAVAIALGGARSDKTSLRVAGAPLPRKRPVEDAVVATSDVASPDPETAAVESELAAADDSIVGRLPRPRPSIGSDQTEDE